MNSEKVILEKVKVGVEAIKDLATLAKELEEKAKAPVVKVLEDKDTDDLPEPTPAKTGERGMRPGKKGRDTGFKHISEQDGYKGFDIVIGFRRPEDGKYTTKHIRRPTIQAAVVARNEVAATLLVESIIDFERYLEIVRG